MEEKLEGTLRTKDKVDISYEHQRLGHKSIIIICPGFFNSKKNRLMKKTRDFLSERYDTVIFDFRGHGDSGGKFSWSAKEHYDLEAILDYLKQFNYESIGLVAYSLGAATAINTISRRPDVNSMVLVSSPCNFWQINFHFWEPEMFSDLKDNMDCDWEGKGAKINLFFSFKRKPINEVKKIKRVPLFFIHGKKDWIIKDYHSQKLYENAPGPKKIELIEDGLHAERLIRQYPEKMESFIFDWFDKTLNAEVLK